MEFVAVSDTVLWALALDDPQLRCVFLGVYSADQLPRFSTKTVPAAYIVNTDPAGELGQHCLGLWTEENKCEIFDSYGLARVQKPGVAPVVESMEVLDPH